MLLFVFREVASTETEGWQFSDKNNEISELYLLQKLRWLEAYIETINGIAKELNGLELPKPRWRFHLAVDGTSTGFFSNGQGNAKLSISTHWSTLSPFFTVTDSLRYLTVFRTHFISLFLINFFGVNHFFRSPWFMVIFTRFWNRLFELLWEGAKRDWVDERSTCFSGAKTLTETRVTFGYRDHVGKGANVLRVVNASNIHVLRSPTRHTGRYWGGKASRSTSSGVSFGVLFELHNVTIPIMLRSRRSYPERQITFFFLRTTKNNFLVIIQVKEKRCKNRIFFHDF